jgi:hypothetical protein
MKTFMLGLLKAAKGIALFVLSFALVWVIQYYLLSQYLPLYGWIIDELRPVSHALVGGIKSVVPKADYLKTVALLHDEFGPKSLFVIGLSGIASLLVETVERLLGLLVWSIAALWRWMFQSRVRAPAVRAPRIVPAE